ncbi:MAG: hypothetical protein CMK89_23720 [Pseudomonadales bacterium]|nr:hypothetical protein [Pseudomonadales bacterium]
MNDVSGYRQGGLSLVYVLVLITAISSVVIHREYVRFLDRQRNAFEFTVAQTQNILNLANAYRLDNGEWPQDNRGDCVPIESDDFLPQFDAVTNGWGFVIGASGDCERRNASYTVSQVIPSEYYYRFQDFFADNVSRRNAGSGYVRLEISVSLESLGASQTLTFESFDDPGWSVSPIFDHEGCDPGEAEETLIGLDAMCAWVKTAGLAPEPVLGGFVVGIDFPSDRVGYKALIDNFIPSPLNDHQPANVLYYSDYRCPVQDNTRKIKAAMFSWCE